MEQEIEVLKKDFSSHSAELVTQIKGLFTVHNAFVAVGVIFVILVYFVIYKLVCKGIRRVNVQKLSDERKSLLIRIARYCFYFAVVVYVLGLFGIKLSAIWGAAGIAGVALGFAAQTSVSNLISGIFIVSEKSLKIGDAISVGGVTGVVDAISLLSVRIHTYDNQMVRIPNSSIISSTLTNNSYNSYRRMTITVDVSYDCDLKFALETLRTAPDFCPTARKKPAPAVWVERFGESGIDLTLAIWFNNSDFVAVKNEAFIAIKNVFDDAKIEIPFNQIVVRNA